MKKRISVLWLLFVFPKLMMFFSLTVFWPGLHEMIDHLTYIVSFQLICLTLIIARHWVKVPMLSPSSLGYQKLIFILFVVTILSYLYVASVGFPLLSANVNYAKLSFNSNPLAARLIRVVIPCILFVIAFRFILKKKFFFLSAVLMLLTGFKGYVVSYLLVPLIHAQILAGRKFGSRIFKISLLGIPFLLFFVSYIENLSILNVFKFIFLRLTVAQHESIIVIADNYGAISNSNPILQSFAAALSKFGIGDVKPFNHDLYTYMHGSNPNNIQLSTSLLVEVYLVFGPIAALIWSGLELLTVMWIFGRFYQYRQSVARLLILFFSYLYFIDVIFNGNVGLKIVDYILSLFVLLTVYFSFGKIYMLLPKRRKMEKKFDD